MFVGRSFSSDKKDHSREARLCPDCVSGRAPRTERSEAIAPNSISSDLSFVWTNDQSNSHLDVCDACPGVCEVEKNKKSKTITKTRTRKTGLRPPQSPFSFLRCSAGILPALLLLVSPFSGTGLPAVPGTLVYPEERRAYPELRRVYPEVGRAFAPLLSPSSSDLGFSTASHSMNARGQAEACPTKNNFLIANPELEFSLSSIKTIPYKFLIAKK
jgi:hypothetical protein